MADAASAGTVSGLRVHSDFLAMQIRHRFLVQAVSPDGERGPKKSVRFRIVPTD